MRTPLATILLTAVAVSPARAQGAKKPVQTVAAQAIAIAIAADDYESQKIKLKAMRLLSVAQFRAMGVAHNGKVVELRGQIKGAIARDETRALLFQLDEGENVVVEAPAAFRNQATEPGAFSRLLCRVNCAPGAENSLFLLNATGAPDPARLFKADDNDLIVAPPGGSQLPPPEQIMIGPDAPLAPTRENSRRQTSQRSNAPAPKQLSSRGMNSRPAAVRPASPYFGFDDSQRAAYKSLARRFNPRLSDEMAGYIASSIISAAQDNNLDPRFLAAVVQVESSFDPYCLSASGAMGLGQLMPFNLRPLGVSNAWDPMQNLRGSARMLRNNLDIYSRQQNGTLLAVAAYHAGVGAVNRAGKTVPARAATQKYVWKVYYAYRALAPELFNR